MSILKRRPTKPDSWASTRWTLVADLRVPEENRQGAAWTWLVKTYLPPMERYARWVLTRYGGKPHSAEEAEEAVQDFLATCVEKGSLEKADREKGGFRTFVRTLLKRHCISLLRYRGAQIRNAGPGRQEFPIREDDRIDEQTPDEVAELREFDRSWTRIAVDRTLDRLKRENPRYYTVAKDLLETDGEGRPDLIERVNVSRSQFPVLKNRVRVRFSKLFGEELAETVADPQAFEEEWYALAPYVARYAEKGKRPGKD